MYRREFLSGKIDEHQLPADPYLLFNQWLTDASDASLPDYNAMIVSTVGAGLKPSSRVVLLRQMALGQLCFFTNYESRKGQELEENPNLSGVFFWAPLERQVRLSGYVEKLSSSQNDDYFNQRPVGSRISAIVSPQSRVIENREVLEKKFKNLSGMANTLTRPSNWGGYKIIIQSFEFWQGRENRLHDRVLYSLLTNNTWKISWLAP